MPNAKKRSGLTLQQHDVMKSNNALRLRQQAIALALALSMALLPGCAQPTVAEQPTPSSSPTAASSVSPSTASADEPEQTPEVPAEPDYLLEARAINDDVVGWIKIGNTRIDYPVLKTTDNEFYINHDLEKNDSKSGAIFMDLRNVDPKQQRHIIFYGHNMKNGTMFHDLNYYKEKDFFNNNRLFTVWLFGEERQYEVIGEFLLSVEINFIRTSFDTDDEFTGFLSELQKINKFKTGYTPDPADEILTLSTCTYEYEDEMRNVVQARRVK